jgi:hypothetical protein
VKKLNTPAANGTTMHINGVAGHSPMEVDSGQLNGMIHGGEEAADDDAVMYDVFPANPKSTSLYKTVRLLKSAANAPP